VLPFLGHFTCLPTFMSDFSPCLQASQASAELRRNLEQESTFVTQFLVALDAAIEPLQQARCLVASYPYMPDALALCSALGASHRFYILCTVIAPAAVPYMLDALALCSALSASNQFSRHRPFDLDLVLTCFDLSS